MTTFHIHDAVYLDIDDEAPHDPELRILWRKARFARDGGATPKQLADLVAGWVADPHKIVLDELASSHPSPTPAEAPALDPMDLSHADIRAWTQAALDVQAAVSREQLEGVAPLFVVELIHAHACAWDAAGNATFSIDTSLLVSLLARLLRREISCERCGGVPQVPAEWDCEAPVFCASCADR